MSEQPGHHWAHVRAQAAEGGLYATCLAELCDHVNEENKSTATCIIDLRRSMQLLVDALANAGERLNALEARPEAQVLPTTPREGGPTLLAPIQLQQGIEPTGELLERVSSAIVKEDWMGNGLDPDDCYCSDPGFRYTSAAIEAGLDVHSEQARAAILAVAEWFDSSGSGAIASVLRQELKRG